MAITPTENRLPGQPLSPAPATILVVDDDDAIRKLLTAWLTLLGHTVKAADDAETALEILEQGHVDAVICDILMPRRDGVWLMNRLRSNYPNVAIIIATGSGDMSPSVTLQARVAGYLTKPFGLDDLRAVLKRALEEDSPLLRITGEADAIQDVSET